MTLHDPVKDYKVLKKKQNSEKALEILKKVSSQVKPILEKRAWTVKNLCEFFPTNPNLLGNLNFILFLRGGLMFIYIYIYI